MNQERSDLVVDRPGWEQDDSSEVQGAYTRRYTLVKPDGAVGAVNIVGVPSRIIGTYTSAAGEREMKTFPYAGTTREAALEAALDWVENKAY